MDITHQLKVTVMVLYAVIKVKVIVLKTCKKMKKKRLLTKLTLSKWSKVKELLNKPETEEAGILKHILSGNY